MAGAGGGAWKVAYADFVTAMMAFFMVMWITVQSKQIKQAVAHYFNEATQGPSDPEASKQGHPSRSNEHSDEIPDPNLKLQGKAGRKAKQERPNLAVLHDGNKEIDGAVVPFDELSATLDARGQEQLKKLVPLLLGKRYKIEVRGHATRRPPPPDSPYRDAWQLSYARCVAVMNYLKAAGIELDRIRLSQAGPYEPYTLRVALAKQGQNSRVEIYALNEVADEFAGTKEERAERYKPAILDGPAAGKTSVPEKPAASKPEHAAKS